MYNQQSMTEIEIKKGLNRNIKLWGAYKIFTKRVFIPLITIYAAQQAGLNIQQIGLTSALASVASILCDTTTGFWADVHGRKKSAQVGAAIAAVGSLLYVIATGFSGILAASLVVAVGYSFLNGSMEALIHDSLVVLKKEENYAKIASRAQSMSLVANAAIVSLIPLLYPIDKRLPFVAGFAAYCFLFYLACLLTEPNVHHDVIQEKLKFIKTVRLIMTHKSVLFFACAGLAYAITTGAGDVFNLGIIKLGMQPKYLGILYGGASLVGAALGLWIHNLRKLTFKQYATFDLATSFVPFVTYGIFKSLPLAIASFIINFCFWRYQQIMYQHYVLQIYGTSRYKATIVSLMTNFRSLHEAWIALVFSGFAKHIGLLPALGYGSLLPIVFLPVLLFSISQFSANARAEVESSNQ
jgi:MFS family permease